MSEIERASAWDFTSQMPSSKVITGNSNPNA
jgi:hypothetical protein